MLRLCAARKACEYVLVALVLGGTWLARPVSATPATWKGGGGNAHWSNSGNWTGNLPAPSVAVIFLTNGVVLNNAPNNIVTTSMTIQSLVYAHTNGYNTTPTYHHTYLNDGVTLLVSNASTTNALLVGSGLALASAATRAAISGTNASLVIQATNGVFNVRQGGGQNFYGSASLDLAGLSNCTVRARRVLVAGDGTNAGGEAEKDRPAGSLRLARNNWFQLTGGSHPPALTVGFNIGNGSSTNSSLTLGQTNFIYADTGLGVGLGKAQSNLAFGAASNSLAVFRNTAGDGPQHRWLIGDGLNVGYSGNPNAGVVTFSGGTVDAQVSQIIVGRGVNDTKGLDAAGGAGSLSLDAGIITANTLIVGYQVNHYSARVNGTVNVDGTAVVVVQNGIQLGRFLAAAASNGVSSAALNIGTRTGGGRVIVHGSITTLPNPASANDSRLVLRNGGSLTVGGSIGPLLAGELNNCLLNLDFGAATNPGAPVCYVTNLVTAAPIALSVSGSRLTHGQFSLFKYQNLTGAGFAGFTSLTWSNQLTGFLSNNVANSSVDLVITSSPPGTNPPARLPPRLAATPPVYADYAKILAEAAPRADGYLHLDTPALIARLREGNIKTYAYLCWMTKTEWDDFRTEFLPAAQAAGIAVYLYLTPPTENNPPAGYVPFGDDYYSWLTEAARLANRFPVLKAVVMDDFNSNLGLFTPDYVRRITDAAQELNPNLLFMVINYDLTKGWASPTAYTSPAFMNAYRPSLGAVMFAYLNWAAHDDLTDAAYQIAHNAGIVNGQLAQFLVNFPSGKPTAAGNHASVSQLISNHGAPFPHAPYPYTFRVSGYPNTSTSGYHQLQFLVDDTVIWSRDIANAYGVQDITTNLQPWLAGKSSATLSARVYDQAGVSSFFIRSSWILPGGPWIKTEAGGFTGTSTYYPAESNGVPMLVMLYDWMYGTGGNNNSNYVYNANRIAQNAVFAGQTAGIIQFQLDKSAASPLFPIIQQLYGQWAFQPRIVSLQRPLHGATMLTGSNGGPNIRYTLRAAADPAIPAAGWTAVATNVFLPDGTFTTTDDSADAPPARFYRLSVP